MVSSARVQPEEAPSRKRWQHVGGGPGLGFLGRALELGGLKQHARGPALRAAGCLRPPKPPWMRVALLTTPRVAWSAEQLAQGAVVLPSQGVGAMRLRRCGTPPGASVFQVAGSEVGAVWPAGRPCDRACGGDSLCGGGSPQGVQASPAVHGRGPRPSSRWRMALGHRWGMLALIGVAGGVPR
jgi:hypothetical protein